MKYNDSLDLSGIVKIDANDLGLTRWELELPEGLQKLDVSSNELVECEITRRIVGIFDI